MDCVICNLREWLEERKIERHIREVRTLYAELQKYGTLRKERQIVNKVTY